MLLPPLLAGGAVLCLLLAVAISFGQRGAKADNPLAPQPQDRIVERLAIDLEGTPTRADVRRARKPLSERQRLLRAHPYFQLYRIAGRRFGVSWYLVAAVHYQETGFGEAPATLASTGHWKRHRDAAQNLVRPATYPNRTKRHPSVKDDFDVVMAVAADLRARGARELGDDTKRAVAARYGAGPDGRLATAMVVERARAWRLLGILPLPGRGELATPVKGVVGGCGYFGCPRPGHLHNGVDFLAPTGTPIHAADAGVVAVVESPGASGGYGNFACIQHRPHLATCYAHLSAFAAALRPGAPVRRGQVIGLVGSTGHSTAPHLHFEVRRGRADCSACSVDPLPMLSGEVPSAVLPKMDGRAPVAPRAAAPAPVAVAPAPAARERDGGGAQAEQDDEQGSPPARPRNRGRVDGEATGGAAPDATAPSRTPGATEPAARKAPKAAPAPPPAAPAPATSPPTTDAGTGGAAPGVSAATAPPPPPPPPPAASSPPAAPPSPPDTTPTAASAAPG